MSSHHGAGNEGGGHSGVAALNKPSLDGRDEIETLCWGRGQRGDPADRLIVR